MNPIRYKAHNSMEFLHAGEVTPSARLEKKGIKTYPLSISDVIGKYGSLQFKETNAFVPLVKDKINITDGRAYYNVRKNKSIYINGVVSYLTGTARALLMRTEIIAKYRKIKYMHIATKQDNKKMIKVLTEAGYTQFAYQPDLIYFYKEI